MRQLSRQYESSKLLQLQSLQLPASVFMLPDCEQRPTLRLMCGRATVINPDGITEKVYGFTRKFVPSDWKPRYNLNPHEDIPAVYYDPFLKERVLRTMHWNLIPSKLENRDSVVEF